MARAVVIDGRQLDGIGREFIRLHIVLPLRPGIRARVNGMVLERGAAQIRVGVGEEIARAIDIGGELFYRAGCILGPVIRHLLDQ